MRYLLLLLPLFLIAKPFKIATYNVENLFDDSFDGSEYEEYIPGKHNWNRKMVQIKLNHTAEVICDIDADIIGLQEIENSAIFKQLIHRLDRVGCGYGYSAITSKKGAPVQVALLSRHLIKKYREIEVSYAPRVRNILEVDVQIDNKPLKLFVNHWKSKAYKGYESKRIKYAKALQARISRLGSTTEYLLIGDFNSDYNANLTLDDRIDDTGGKIGFLDILKTDIQEHEMPKAKHGWHYTLWNELSIDKRWSQKFFGKKSTPDHILLPKHMFDAKGFDYVNDSFSVFKARYLFAKKGYINRWSYKNGKHMAKGYSDHLPIYAYFDTKGYIPNGKTIYKKETTKKDIEYLYTLDSIKKQVILKDAVVILKRGRNAIIKQTPKGRGIFLYGCASSLKEGYSYDILVDSIKNYKGLKEINSAYKLKQKGRVDISSYLADSLRLDTLKQNEVIHKIEGVYKNNFLYTQGNKRIAIHFKKKKIRPKNNSKLKIDYAHIGYYNRRQLVIYNKNDFTILE